ncbi:MAG: YafY family transcriptional regulator [Actinobacteria bacterium]|nr:YafY family transcriptional regulator [Actinomycetota bacterium]
MSSRRAERLVNLVICLLSTRQFLPANRIRQAVPGYEPAGAGDRADEAFKRMFERDKAELRELGVPLETGRNSVFDAEDGYRIGRRDYELPEIALAPDEAAAVGLAARLWQSAQMAEAANGALLKLRAAGVDLEPGAPGIEPRVDATDPAFQPCLDAVRARQAISFDYRKSADPTGQRREIEPWGVVSWRGRWYVVGHDRARAAVRCFRMSRIAGPVRPAGPANEVVRPDGTNLVEIVAGTVRAEPNRRTARLTVRPDTAAGLRRAGRVLGAELGRDVVEIDYSDVDWLAGWVAGFGTAVLVSEPAELRAAVVHRLTSVLREQRAPAGDDVVGPTQLGGTR